MNDPRFIDVPLIEHLLTAVEIRVAQLERDKHGGDDDERTGTEGAR